MIHTMLPQADAIIAATTPDYHPATPFRVAPYNGPLEGMPFGGITDGTRRYHVLSGIGQEGGGPRVLKVMGTYRLHISDKIVVRVRYHCPLRDGGLLECHQMIGSDAARIVHALVTRITGCAAFAPSGTARVDSAASLGAMDTPDVFVLNLPFDVQYFVQ